jgi:hypothetical protein|tara:strand:- start:1423 stop:1710 length:288 start_codon:yes stop_codon:yes gene_type:complete
MEELVTEGIIKAGLRIILIILRVIYFIGWELFVEYVGWAVGWCICRVITIGHYPKYKINSYEDAPLSTVLVVNGIGIFFVAGSIAILAEYLRLYG